MSLRGRTGPQRDGEQSLKPEMNDIEESDDGIVAMRAANKGRSCRSQGRHPRENRRRSTRTGPRIGCACPKAETGYVVS